MPPGAVVFSPKGKFRLGMLAGAFFLQKVPLRPGHATFFLQNGPGAWDDVSYKL